jgi:hypothetical protein
MIIQFDLPPTAASLLLRLMDHIREHTGTVPSADAICCSMITDLLIDDLLAHGAAAGQSSLTMQ